MSTVLEFFLSHTAWGVSALAIGVAVGVLRIFGWRAAVGVMAAALPVIAYRRGADRNRIDNNRAADHAGAMIHEAEADAVLAGERAAKRVRDQAGRDHRNDAG